MFSSNSGHNLREISPALSSANTHVFERWRLEHNLWRASCDRIDHPQSGLPQLQCRSHLFCPKPEEASQPRFASYLYVAISETWEAIGLLKYLFKYPPRHTLNELCKLYVCPHLDYGDVIHHIPAKVCDLSQNIVCQI